MIVVFELFYVMLLVIVMLGERVQRVSKSCALGEKLSSCRVSVQNFIVLTHEKHLTNYRIQLNSHQN